LSESASLAVFTLDEQPFALRLSAVERVIHAVEVTPLPTAPALVLGVINVQGQVVPAFDLRRRLRLPERDISPNDQLIIARTKQRTVALVVDTVSGVVDCPGEEIIPAEKIFRNLEYVGGILKLEDGLILIHDLDQFLSLEEEQMLEEAMSQRQAK